MTGNAEEDEEYGIAEIEELEEVEAPDLPYQPIDPEEYNPPIGLIGTGGISEQHLEAYSAAGYNVVALCNRTRRKAVDRRDEFYPEAEVYTDYREVLERDDVEVVDLTPHPRQREPIIEDSLRAGKHVLSQKPFVVDLDFGEEMVQLAEEMNVRLAVNQNGRWAPHFSYIRRAISEGLLGQVLGVHLNVHWNHNWIADTEINDVEHAILFDFAVHWFDIVTCFTGDKEAKRVYASYERTDSQTADPPMLAQALIEYPGAQSTLAFDADTRLGPEDNTYVAGSRGTVKSRGPDLTEQEVTIHTRDGYGRPDLEGTWFPDGFHGTMGALLRAVEEDREPSHSGRNNLKTLELCFAAVASAEDHEPKQPGDVRVMRGYG